MENKNEAVIANYIEKMMGERRQKIFESDEYIQQDNGDLDYLEERYSSHRIRKVLPLLPDHHDILVPRKYFRSSSQEIPAF